MEFAVLGSVLVDGRAPAGAIERALLARLLVAPGAPVSAEELIEAGWPEDRRASAGASLRVRLAALRELLEPGRVPGAPASVLVRGPGGYQLTVAPEQVDAARFVRLAGEAARLPAGPALEACDAALALWRGEPFGELDGVEVAAAEARRLHAVRAALRQRRAAGLRELDRLDEAVAELEALVADDPLREELVRELMLCLYRAGRVVESLAAYRALSGGLAELGLQPGPAVRELEALVLRHAEELARPAAPASASPHPTNLGARVTSVLGREEALAAVLDALESHRIVTLVGPGGVGKTTLAGEAARAALLRVPDGAWLVELAPLRDCDEILPAAATAMGLRRIGRAGEERERDALELLRERMRVARVLLVLDGGEHLVPGLGTVALELASAGSEVRVLVTSRRALAVPGEAVVGVPSLALPDEDADADAVRSAAAVRLFEERARAARPGWRLDATEAAVVTRICRRLDGLPLALELAAARVRALSTAAIAERLEHGLAVLGRGTLDASIEASNALLAPAEQELYRRLSVFERTFELEDAERVAGGEGLAVDDVLELLVALVEHSMVQAEGESPRRYRMLEALRIDARARLGAEEAGSAARRHAKHLARLAASAAKRVGVEGAEAAGEPMIQRRADLEAAFRHALAAADADAALDLAAGLHAMHHLLGTLPAGIEQAAAALRLGGSGPHRLGLLWWHAPMLLAELRVADARAAVEEIRALLPAHGTEGDAEWLRLLTGQVALTAGDLDAARAALDGVAARLVRRGEWFTAGTAAWSEGAAALLGGDPATALVKMREARDLLEVCEDVCSLDGAAADVAQTAAMIGDAAEAAAACAHALGLAPERPLGERKTHLIHEAALVAARQGDHTRAAELAAAAATAAHRDPVALGAWNAEAVVGDLALMRGDVAGARERFKRARAVVADLRARTGPSLPATMSLLATELRLARATAAAGDRDGALVHARAALAHAHEMPTPAGTGAALEAVRRLEAAAVTAQ